MGKSNKYDYTNRSNSGPKFGQIIGQTFEKDADKALREAGKQFSRSLHGLQSISSSAGAFTYTGPAIIEPTIHRLNVVVPGKDLTDEGVIALVDGLEKALRKGHGAAGFMLEDLNLTGNRITTASLARLAPVIVESELHLQTLVLSNNEICVQTSVQQDEWKIFLRAFYNCRALRCLDLSGNRNLGERALEILCGVHTIGDIFDPSCKDDFRELRCGLRSIPFIKLEGTGLNDAGALWLSHILEEHYYPSQLVVNQLFHNPPTSQLRKLERNGSMLGIDWDNNYLTIGKDGLALLKKAESVRWMMLSSAGFDSHSTANEEDTNLPVEITPTIEHIAMLTATTGAATSGNYRVGLRSARTLEAATHELTEVESARKKIARSIIAQHGVGNVCLWKAGLCVVTYSRMLAGIFLPSSALHGDKHCLDIDFSFPDSSIHSRPSHSSANDSEAAVSSPLDPSVVVVSEDAMSSTDTYLLSPTLRHLKIADYFSRHTCPGKYLEYQKKYKTGLAKHTRIQEVAGRLPRRVIENIVRYTLSHHEKQSLSAPQWRRGLKWGCTAQTVEQELKWRRMPDSSQVWTLLDSIDCLKYDGEWVMSLRPIDD